jgi:hypothetical protein
MYQDELLLTVLQIHSDIEHKKDVFHMTSRHKV